MKIGFERIEIISLYFKFWHIQKWIAISDMTNTLTYHLKHQVCHFFISATIFHYKWPTIRAAPLAPLLPWSTIVFEYWGIGDRTVQLQTRRSASKLRWRLSTSWTRSKITRSVILPIEDFWRRSCRCVRKQLQLAIAFLKRIPTQIQLALKWLDTLPMHWWRNTPNLPFLISFKSKDRL